MVPFDPKEVVASHPVVHYTILPQEAGLLQLLAEKKISIVERGTYLIEKPIDRFPGNLSGAHSVRFTLKDGIPLPEGFVAQIGLRSDLP